MKKRKPRGEKEIMHYDMLPTPLTPYEQDDYESYRYQFSNTKERNEEENPDVKKRRREEKTTKMRMYNELDELAEKYRMKRVRLDVIPPNLNDPEVEKGI